MTFASDGREHTTGLWLGDPWHDLARWECRAAGRAPSEAQRPSSGPAKAGPALYSRPAKVGRLTVLRMRQARQPQPPRGTLQVEGAEIPVSDRS